MSAEAVGATGVQPGGGGPRPPRLLGSGGVWIVTGLLSAMALAAYLTLLHGLGPLPGAPLHVPWWALVPLFYLGEIFAVHVEFRRGAHSFSLAEIPLVIGLFFTSPGELLLAHLVGAFMALGPHLRQRPIKLGFNLAQFAAITALSTWLFRRLLGPGDPLDATAWSAAFVSVLTAALMSSLLISVAISLTEGRFDTRAVARNGGFGLVNAAGNTSLALVAVNLLWLRPEAVWLLGFPTALLFAAYRIYTVQRRKHEAIRALYDSARALQRSVRLDDTIRALLARTREVFRTEFSEILFLHGPTDDGATGATMGPSDGEVVATRFGPQDADALSTGVAASDQAVIARVQDADPALRAYLERRGMTDAILAPLRSEGRIVGVLAVANRLGETSEFDEHDRTLFETLASNASVVLENARLVAELERSLIRAHELNRMKEDFVSTVSHELRTPLTGVIGSVKTILKAGTTLTESQQRDLLVAADRSGDRLHRLIEQLLEVSRVESGAATSAIAPVSIPDVARRVVDELRKKGNTHAIKVMIPDLRAVLTDEWKLHQILSNLVENATKYSPAGTTVRIRAREEAEGVSISVVDEGSGIPPQHWERIFERFFQVDASSTRRVEGAGLGLYITRQLALQLGGHVSLERSGPEGSVFKVYLPYVAPRPAASSAPSDDVLDESVLELRLVPSSSESAVGA